MLIFSVRWDSTPVDSAQCILMQYNATMQRTQQQWSKAQNEKWLPWSGRMCQHRAVRSTFRTVKKGLIFPKWSFLKAYSLKNVNDYWPSQAAINKHTPIVSNSLWTSGAVNHWGMRALLTTHQSCRKLRGGRWVGWSGRCVDGRCAMENSNTI